MNSIAYVTLVVRDYDEALAFYCGALGFERVEDRTLSATKRWVVVKPRGSGNAGLLLAKAATPDQSARIGDQTGGRVSFFLYTDDFQRDHAAMKSRGVKFLEEPRFEDYGVVAVFVDLYGNRWDLLQPK